MIWPTFWLVLFAVAFGGFVIVSVVIAVRGVGEIRDMLRRLGTNGTIRPPEPVRRPGCPPRPDDRTET